METLPSPISVDPVLVLVVSPNVEGEGSATLANLVMWMHLLMVFPMVILYL